jgi:hypothetical protein
MKRIVLLVGAMIISLFQGMAFADQWYVNNISSLFIYPTYVVIDFVSNDDDPGPANCPTPNGISFDWASFDQPTQNRIMASLLTAKTTNQTIAFVVTSSGCGPEGRKLFNGQLYFP